MAFVADFQGTHMLRLTTRVRSTEAVTLTAQIGGVATSDADKDKRAAILCERWLDAKGTELPAKRPELSTSDKYGHFQYISFKSPSGAEVVNATLVAPKGAHSLTLDIMTFANPSLYLIGSSLVRQGLNKG